MSLGIKIPGVTSSGIPGYRVKTDGPGTLRTHDFKNPLTFPASVSSPTTSIPSGTLLSDLPPLSVATPSSPATVIASAIVQSAGGGLKLGSGSWNNTNSCIFLPSDYGLPALSGADGHFLIILGYKPGSAAANGSTISAIAGWGSTNTGATTNNWTIYRAASNAATFAQVGNSFQNLGTLSVAPHRIALEITKLGGAGTVQLDCYVDGVKNPTGAQPAVSLAALAQPANSPWLAPSLGGCQWGSNQDAAAEYESITIRNLANDTMSVADIIAADYAAWGGTSRFS